MREDTKSWIRRFVAERDWEQFHTPTNLAKSIAIEAAELLEHYQWTDNAELSEVQEEIADVLIYTHMLAWKLGLDPDTIMREKLVLNEKKYPVAKARGKSTRYDRLDSE